MLFTNEGMCSVSLQGTKFVDARVGTPEVGSGEPYSYCVQLTTDEYEKQKLMGKDGTIDALTRQMFAVADDTELEFRAKKKWLMLVCIVQCIFKFSVFNLT